MDPIKAVLYTHFEDVEGYVVSESDPPNVMIDQFKDIGYHFLPDRGICWRLISLVLGEYRIIGVPVHIDDSRYARRAFVFCFCIIVSNSSHQGISLAKIAAQELAYIFYNLENDTQYLSSKSSNLLSDFLQNFRTNLNNPNILAVNQHIVNNVYIQFSKPATLPISKRENNEIRPYFTPVSTCAIPIDAAEWIRHSVITLIIDACNGINSVADISNILFIDYTELSNVLLSLSNRGLVVIINQAIDGYTRVRLTQKFHTFFDTLDNRQEAIAYIGGPTDVSDDHTQGDVLVRNYCKLDGHVSDLSEMSAEINRHMILFGLIKGFLRCKTMYPVYTDYVSTMVPVLRLCDGIHTWDDICAQFQLSRLEISEIFNHHGVLKIWV